jgi:nitrogen fixation/metabolism regulation signal transduction histidine kinase
MEPWLERFARVNIARSSDTAHDLKTPLNVAVLNLELLRMRIRKVVEEEDEKSFGYIRSIECELRRMAQIFDTFFLLSAPPKNDAEVRACPMGAAISEAAAEVGLPCAVDSDPTVMAHETRIRQALRLFFEGAAKVLTGATGRLNQQDSEMRLVVAGELSDPSIELNKVFKFYYTDPLGNPDLSLSAARLIAETYGGTVECAEEDGRVTLRMVLPLGER